MTNEIRLFVSPLTGKVYASSEFEELSGGKVKITGEKSDVTEEFKQIMAMIEAASSDHQWYRVTSADPESNRVTGFKGTPNEAARVAQIADSMGLRLIIWDPDGFLVLADDG